MRCTRNGHDIHGHSSQPNTLRRTPSSAREARYGNGHVRQQLRHNWWQRCPKATTGGSQLATRCNCGYEVVLSFGDLKRSSRTLRVGNDGEQRQQDNPPHPADQRHDGLRSCRSSTLTTAAAIVDVFWRRTRRSLRRTEFGSRRRSERCPRGGTSNVDVLRGTVGEFDEVFHGRIRVV